MNYLLSHPHAVLHSILLQVLRNRLLKFHFYLIKKFLIIMLWILFNQNQPEDKDFFVTFYSC